jgi:hypothetical protein
LFANLTTLNWPQQSCCALLCRPYDVRSDLTADLKAERHRQAEPSGSPNLEAIPGPSQTTSATTDRLHQHSGNGSLM